MKHFEMKDVKRPVLKSVICDTCDKECEGTHVDILLKFSFCDNPEELETICYNCYENRFEKQLKHVREAKVKDIFVSQDAIEQCTHGDYEKFCSQPGCTDQTCNHKGRLCRKCGIDKLDAPQEDSA